MKILQIDIFGSPEELIQKSVPDTAAIRGQIVEHLAEFQGKSTSEIFTILLEDLISFGFKVIAALLIYAFGAWLIRRVRKLLKRYFDRRGTEASLAGFILSLANITMIIFLVVVVVGVLGINTTSFAALLASGGLAVGMALSGALQNFAGGIMLLAFKPFKVGDYIEAAGYEGTVQTITITATKIATVDNKIIIIPNGTLSSSNIRNFSASQIRRVDWTVSITYGDDVDKAREVILGLFADDTRILSDPNGPVVHVAALANSSVDLSIRAWVNSENYWSVFFCYNELFYKVLPTKGIHFPYPHITVVPK